MVRAFSRCFLFLVVIFFFPFAICGKCMKQITLKTYVFKYKRTHSYTQSKYSGRGFVTPASTNHLSTFTWCLFSNSLLPEMQYDCCLRLILRITFTHRTTPTMLFLYLLVLLIDTASQHRLVGGVEGGSVVLLCSHRRIVLEENQLTVYWRHNDTRNVYDIIRGEVSVKEQDPAYKNRAEVLPEELKNSQISLKLTDLQLSDGGTYICFIPDVGVHHSTRLVVRERPVTEHRTVRVRSHGTETSLGRSLQLLLLLSGFIRQFL